MTVRPPSPSDPPAGHTRSTPTVRAQSVTPEAVSFLHKALKIHVYRMMSAGVNSRRGSSSAPPHTLGKRSRAEPTQLTREGLAAGMHQPHHLGTWTLPHSQRFNLAAAAFARQHFLL